MDFLNELENMGVNVREGLDRVMGDKDLYTMMLGMFLADVDGSPIHVPDFDGSDLSGLISKVHMLKGTTGNLSITPLFHSYTEVLGLLREGRSAEAKEMFEKLLPVQERIVDCIRRNQ